jgi:ABC-type uncharacterized transport system permease subunit
MPEEIYARQIRPLLAAILLGLIAALLSYGIGLARRHRPPLSFARAIVGASAFLLLVLVALLWVRTGRFPLLSLGGFLAGLSLAQIGLALALDFGRGHRLVTIGAAFAGLLNMSIAFGFLAPGAHSPSTTGGGSILHIATFLVSYVAFDVLFISAFTALLLQRLLKRKEGLWMLEVAPSLEAATRASRAAILVGFAAFTVGVLSGYLHARGSALPHGWRLDIIITLASVTWLAYLAALVLGFRSAFRSRSFHVTSLVSFGMLICTLFGLLWSGLHRSS